jgi:hypothetical protein
MPLHVYHIELDDASKEMCTITTQWGKYEYQRLSMGLCNSADIFQEKMTELLAGLDSVGVYLDGLLHVSKGWWEAHLTTFKELINRIQVSGLEVNAKKSFFGMAELEYLGYNISRTGITSIPKKVQGIQAIQPLKTRKQLSRFIGMVNFYRDMWRQRSELLAPLS